MLCCGGGGVSGTQNIVYQQWPTEISPSENFIFSLYEFWWRRGGPDGGLGRGGEHPCPNTIPGAGGLAQAQSEPRCQGRHRGCGVWTPQRPRAGHGSGQR